jgi:hypothetical protein
MTNRGLQIEVLFVLEKDKSNLRKLVLPIGDSVARKIKVI